MVEKVRIHQKSESEKVGVLIQKHRQSLENVKLRANQCLFVKQSLVTPSHDGSKPFSALSDLDIVNIFTNFKHLKNIQSTAAEGTQGPFVHNPISFQKLEADCRFGEVVDENECLSDFDKDDSVIEGEKEDVFHDCEGIPYCLEGEQVMQMNCSIDEIVPITQNIAYIRSEEDLYRVRKTRGHWKKNFRSIECSTNS